MVDLATAILTLYPTAQPLVDFTVVNNNGAETITQWNTKTLGVQPTTQQLAAVTPQQVTAYQATLPTAEGAATIQANTAYLAKPNPSLADVTAQVAVLTNAIQILLNNA